MIGTVQQAKLPDTGITIRAESSRTRIIAACSAFGALGWIISELAYELLLGPHIRLLRAVAVGSGIGAVVGLLISTLQWSVLRHYVSSAGQWIVATTAGFTLGGFLSSLLLSSAIDQTDFFRSTLGVQSILSGGVTGLVVGLMQWPVWRNWVGQSLGWKTWIMPLTVGSALAAPIAWLAGVGVLALLALTVGTGAWPLVIAGSYLAAGFAGSAVYGRFLAMGFRRVLPTPESSHTAVTGDNSQTKAAD